MVEVAALLEAGLYVFLLLLFFWCLGTLLRRLVLVREGVSIHNTRIMNDVRPSLLEVVYQ